MTATITKSFVTAGPAGPEHHERYETVRHSAVIDFQKLIEIAVVEYDSDAEPPWVSQDGWEHQLEEFDVFGGRLQDFQCTRGYTGPPHRDGRVVITDDSFCGDSRQQRFERFRLQGASKQVARELVAQQDREYIDQLVKWYCDGYCEVYVSLKVDIGGVTYRDACGGFDEEYGTTGGVKEVAEEVARKLVGNGYTVRGYDPKSDSRSQKLRRLRENQHLFDVS